LKGIDKNTVLYEDGMIEMYNAEITEGENTSSD